MKENEAKTGVKSGKLGRMSPETIMLLLGVGSTAESTKAQQPHNLKNPSPTGNPPRATFQAPCRPRGIQLLPHTHSPRTPHGGHRRYYTDAPVGPQGFLGGSSETKRC